MGYRIDIDIENIKSLLNMNESELAEAINVPRSTLYRWKKEKSKISNQYLETLYNFAYSQGIKLNYNISLDWNLRRRSGTGVTKKAAATL